MRSCAAFPHLSWRRRDLEHQRYVVAQAWLDPVLVSTNHQGEGTIRPIFGHEHVIDVIATSCPAVLKVRRFGFVSVLYTACHMVSADQPETRQVANRVDVVNRPSGLVPAHMIVEVTRNDCRGRPQEPVVSSECLPQRSRIALSSIASAGILGADAKKVDRPVQTGQPTDGNRYYPAQGIVMAVPVEFSEDGRTEPGQKQPPIRILADPDQRRIGKLGGGGRQAVLVRPLPISRQHRAAASSGHRSCDAVPLRSSTQLCASPVPNRA